MIFTGGCNLTCPFCHNPGLVLDPETYPDIPQDELLEDLRWRSRFIDGVVISGGEPTLDPGLPAFLSQLKELGLQVKLDSNGLLPNVLQQLLAEQLLDYLAIDIKTSPSRYHELHSLSVDCGALLQTIELAKKQSIDVEFRTTCVPGLVGSAEINELGELLRGAPLWVLQQYLADHALAENWQQRESYSSTQLEVLSSQAREYVDQVQLRGI